MSSRHHYFISAGASILALVSIFSASPAEARPKGQGGGVSCSCVCESDARGSGFFPIASSDASFTADDKLDCQIGGGDCAVHLGNGHVLPGTLHHCSVGGSGSGSASLAGGNPLKGILTNPIGNAPPRQTPIPFRPFHPPHGPVGVQPIIQ